MQGLDYACPTLLMHSSPLSVYCTRILARARARALSLSFSLSYSLSLILSLSLSYSLSLILSLSLSLSLSSSLSLSPPSQPLSVSLPIQMLICDIQGVADYYTDPQIHSLDGFFFLFFRFF